MDPAVSGIRSTERSWQCQTGARAEKVACSPGDDRYFPFPDRLEDARASYTPKGRCMIGGTRRVIIAEGGRTSYDVWLDVRSGQGRLRHQRD